MNQQRLLGELLRASDAARMLGVANSSMQRIRNRHPEIAVIIPGMTKPRYVRSRLVKLLEETYAKR